MVGRVFLSHLILSYQWLIGDFLLDRPKTILSIFGALALGIGDALVCTSLCSRVRAHSLTFTSTLCGLGFHHRKKNRPTAMVHLKRENSGRDRSLRGIGGVHWVRVDARRLHR